MKSRLRGRVAAAATLAAVVALAACGGSSSTSRNRNSSSDFVACVDPSASTTNSSGALVLGMCSSASKWAEVDSAGNTGELKDIADGKIELAVVGRGPVRIKSFNAEGVEVGNDIVKPNGSRGGIVYRVDTSGTQPVFWEAAPIGWNGSTTDPAVNRNQVDSVVEAYNSTLSPKGDWILGNEWEMRAILADAATSNKLGMSASSNLDFYWTNGRFDQWTRFTERSAATPAGYTCLTERLGRNYFLRPVRSFTSGGEGPVAVTATLKVDLPSTSTTTTEAPTTTSTTEAPVPTSTIPEGASEQLFSIDVPTVTIPSSGSIEITPEDVGMVNDPSATDEVVKVQIVVDDAPAVDVSMTEPTKIEVPADASTMVVTYTTKSGEKSAVRKTFATGSDDGSDTTIAPKSADSTVAPASADDLDEANVIVSVSEESGTNVLVFVIPALIVLLIAGALVARRRK